MTGVSYNSVLRIYGLYFSLELHTVGIVCLFDLGFVVVGVLGGFLVFVSCCWFFYNVLFAKIYTFCRHT